MENLVSKLKEHFDNQLELSENGRAIYVNKNIIAEIMKYLKEDAGFPRLVDVTSADYIDYYEVIYHLSNSAVELLSVKVKVDKETSEIPTISSVWKAANQLEREIYDLMGIVFKGHENLTRILCPESFVGHPLQKSFKLDKVSRF
jgi:NADH-quinone oxidoreductase subunit C